jgi:hypothetical protein
MPRNTTMPEAILALSPSATARALGIHPRHMTDAIDQGLLIVRQIGTARRIAVFGKGGVQEWFSSWPIAKRKVSHGRLHD